MPEHVHNHAVVVRQRGSRVRKQCACKHIGPWVKELNDITPIPSTNPVVLRVMTLVELRRLAKDKGIKGFGAMKKETLIERLTEVTPVGAEG